MLTFSAILTFLFTDIEGSTKLWEANPYLMAVALKRHDEILRAVIESQGGRVFKTVGDAFCAVFEEADNALSAAVEAQRTLHAEPWDSRTIIRVRVAIHSGVAETRDQDFFGPTLNRIARLLSAGHGGQTLVSLPARELLLNALPGGISFRDLGPHRLKDLQRPEQIFQLSIPGLQVDFPALHTLDAIPNNLPIQLASFVGREKELEDLKVLFGKKRLVTLTGAGGAGKTRLALQAAADMLTNYRDGAWFVDLAPLTNPDLVPSTVAASLGLSEEAGKTIAETLTSYIKDKQLLLVLDNCEHLIEAAAMLSNFLLQSSSGLRILATSREILGIAGETIWRVPSLTIPGDEAMKPEALAAFESVRLFLDRAQAVRPGFGLDEGTASAVGRICRLLDGIPLAIELTAARVGTLSVSHIATKLKNSLNFFTGGNRAAAPRQQTLKAAINWSYKLLSPGEQSLFRQLSVFAGGFDLEAVEEIAKVTVQDEIADLLSQLVNKSLVVVDESEKGEVRYRMLETIRQFAGEKLEESGETSTACARHFDYFLKLAEKGDPELRGPRQLEWFRVFEEEHDNMRKALTWCKDARGGAEARLRLASALGFFWDSHGHHAEEGRQNLLEALSRVAGETLTLAQANALVLVGWLALRQSDFPAAEKHACGGLEAYRQMGDKRGESDALNCLGAIFLEQGRYVESEQVWEESLQISREVGDRRGISACLGNLGSCAEEQLEFEKARALYGESLAYSREAGFKDLEASALGSLGSVAHNLKDCLSARGYHSECLKLRREIGDKEGIAITFLNLAEVDYEEGHYADAFNLCGEVFLIFHALRHARSSVALLEVFTKLLWRIRRFHEAASVAACAKALRQAIGAPRPPRDEADHQIVVEGVRQNLGEEAWSAACERGKAMTLDEVIAYSLELIRHLANSPSTLAEERNK